MIDIKQTAEMNALKERLKSMEELCDKLLIGVDFLLSLHQDEMKKSDLFSFPEPKQCDCSINGASGDCTCAKSEEKEAKKCGCGKSQNQPYCDGSHNSK